MPLVNKRLLLRSTHTLELKIPRMGIRPKLPALQNHKQHGANNGDKVQRKIHQVPQNRLRTKPRKRLPNQLAQPRNRIIPALQLAPRANKRLLPTLDKRAVKSVDESFFDEQRAADNVGDCRAFAEHQQDGGEDREGPVEERHDGCLRQVGEEEHEGCDAHAGRDGGCEAREEGFP